MSFGLVVVSHGGVNSESREVAENHAKKLQSEYELGIGEVEIASIFDGDLSEKINEIDNERVLVLPFLTSPGKHYNIDIPKEISEVEDKEVELLKTFGDHKYVTDALADIIKENKK